jgi:N-acetylglutamate synthase-like GNAT family acetyltransferase
MTESVVVRREFGGHTYEIDSDKERLDFIMIHHFLSRCSHWASGITREVLRRAIAHSLAFGLYRDDEQIGFARVVSDEATFAYLADVFVIAEERNAGLGQWLVETILADPRLQQLRRWLLVTRDAKSLYQRCGFAAFTPGLAYLERFDPAPCGKTAAGKTAASEKEQALVCG